MNILIGCSSPPDKGSGILSYSKELSEALAALGHVIFFASPSPQDTKWLVEHRIEHFETGQHQDQRLTAIALLRYVRARSIQLIINNDNSLVQSIAPGVACPFIAVGHLGQTTIATLACYQHEWSDYVVAISNDMHATFVQKYGVPVLKCPVIYNGIADIGATVKSDFRVNRQVRLVYAGGFNRLKGADHVLRAAMSGADAWDGVHLDWFGSVPKSVEKKISGLPHVTFHGRVSRSNLMAALAESDFLLFPSRVEGCPMAMLEAMSMGVAPIVSDGIGAMRVLVTSGENGYVCHLSSWADQMLECVRYLKATPAIIDEVKRAARETYLARFTSARVARDILRLAQRPTVRRLSPATKIEVLRWHRPLRSDGLKSPLLYRVTYKLGYLLKAGSISVPLLDEV